MGIQGLLPAFKSIITPVHVRQYSGKRVAIDTYSWLHKAAYICSKDLCEGRPTEKFIDYCMHRINLLRHHGVHPVLVFDGAALPMKADQEGKRARVRKEYLERAIEHERSGNHSAALDCYQKAVDITPAIALTLIKVLKLEGIEFVVAPYEADAQMAFFALQGRVEVVITEDSDLIAYGCPRILFKMDKFGQGSEFQYCDIVRNKDLNFSNFTKQMVLEMCVMSGCDYLPSLSGMGVKKAHNLIRRFKNYTKVLKHLRFTGSSVSVQYEEEFTKALLTFRHQRVYDPNRQEIVHLTEVSSDIPPDSDFLGPYLSQKLVRAIAEGDVDPTTNRSFKEEIDAADASLLKDTDLRIDARDAPKRKHDFLVKKNVLTNYFLYTSTEAKKQFTAPRFCTTAEAHPYLVLSEVEHFQTDKNCDKPKLLSHHDFSSVFGTTLPDDDDDTNVSEPLHESVLCSLQHGERSQRRASFLEGTQGQDLRFPIGKVMKPPANDLAGCKSITNLSLNSAERAGSAAMRREIRQSASLSPLVKLSGYFSQPQVLQSKSVRQENSVKDKQKTYTLNVNNCTKEDTSTADGEERIVDDNRESNLDENNPATESNWREIELRGENLTRRTSTEQETPKVFPQKLLSDPAEKRSNFSANVAHVKEYASLADKSMAQFVSQIAPFRSSSRGVRASGLRAPFKCASKRRHMRETVLNGNNIFDQFVHDASTSLSRSGRGYVKPRLVAISGSERQDPSFS